VNVALSDVRFRRDLQIRCTRRPYLFVSQTSVGTRFLISVARRQRSG
jgi:hypothetical protein